MLPKIGLERGRLQGTTSALLPGRLHDAAANADANAVTFTQAPVTLLMIPVVELRQVMTRLAVLCSSDRCMMTSNTPHWFKSCLQAKARSAEGQSRCCSIGVGK